MLVCSKYRRARGTDKVKQREFSRFISSGLYSPMSCYVSPEKMHSMIRKNVRSALTLKTSLK